MGKGTQWGYTATEAIGSTCNIRKLTGKGQVEGKHRDEAYGHRKLNGKGTRVREVGIHAQGSAVCVQKWHKASGKVLEDSVSLGKHQGTSGKG